MVYSCLQIQENCFGRNILFRETEGPMDYSCQNNKPDLQTLHHNMVLDFMSYYRYYVF